MDIHNNSVVMDVVPYTNLFNIQYDISRLQINIWYKLSVGFIYK